MSSGYDSVLTPCQQFVAVCGHKELFRVSYSSENGIWKAHATVIINFGISEQNLPEENFNCF
jgi:hypothetical protein